MPPQRVQRMVQYSEPARPAMMRSTASRPLHSGQVDRAVVRVSGCDMAGITLFDQAVGSGTRIRQVGCEAVHMTSLLRSVLPPPVAQFATMWWSASLTVTMS